MSNEEYDRYLKAYYENESDANRKMAFANAVGAVLLLAIWICYLTGAFHAHTQIMPLINIMFPFSIVVLLTPMVHVFFFKHLLKARGYKFFVVLSFITVIAALNIILPRNSLIAWPLCILITNHYYNPKVGKIIFGTTAALMLLCLFFSMFVGEYDPNILGATQISAEGEVVPVFGIKERYDLLHEALLNGQNRYLEAFVLSYLPRVAILTVIFFVSNSLNVRTRNLLREEILVNNEQAKTKTELEVAKEIQLATLPVEFATSEEVEIQAELKAAKEVGGDFYDYFILDDDHVAILIGDVSGKGIPAAMFMMKTITCFKNYMSVNKTPAEIMKEVNASICEGNESQMFVTCFLAIVNTKNGEVKYANAGHNPPVIGQDTNYKYLKCKSGFVLGVMPEAVVTDEQVTMKNGDTLTLYTDGITEAMNNKRELYGEKRLLDLFNRKVYSCLVELHKDLKDDVITFANGAEQSDDMTYITLKYHGDKYFFEERIFDGVREQLPEMLDFLGNFARNLNLGDSFVNKGLVAADEILSNIVIHGYKEHKGRIFIRALYNVDKKEFILTVIDNGIEFDPFKVNNSPLEGDVSDQKEGGLGILIVKNLASEYAYDRLNDKNITILKKRF